MEAVEIKAGPDLDRRVADAIGLTYPFFDGKPIGLFEPIPEGAEERSCLDPAIPDDWIPSYSLDLNAAFAAAEKAGVFDEWALQKSGGEWTFVDCNDCCNEWIGFAQPTPALTICAAILKLKGPADDGSSADSG